MNKRNNYKRLKKTSAIILLITLFFQFFSILPATKAKAQDITDQYQFITRVTLIGDDGKIINESSNPINKNSEVKLKYNFTIPNKGEIKKGDSYIIHIPKEIKVIRELKFSINADSGDTIANVTIDTNGKVNIVFTEFDENNSNVSGYFYVNTQFDANKIGNSSPKAIEFDLGGNSSPYVVNVNFQQPETPKASVKKEGSYNPSRNEITWKVTVNPENVNINNAQIVDNILTGQEFIPGSVKVNGVNARTTDYNYTDKKLTYNFLSPIHTQQIVTFKTKVTDTKISQSEGTATYEYNTVIFNHDGTTVQSNQASIKVVTDFINKNGSYDAVARRINWTININNNAQHIENAVVIDSIPQGLELTAGSVKLDGASSNSYKVEGQKFIYPFKNSINEPHRITFSTDVVDPEAYNSNQSKVYNNTVDLKGQGVPSNASDIKGVGVPTSIINKQGIGYNPATREITWKVTINNNKISIKNPVVTDDIRIGQEYVQGSASIDKGTPNGVFQYTKAAVNDRGKTGTLTYKFNDTINEIRTITFKTRVTDPNVYAGNKNQNYYNVAKLTGDNIITSTSQGRQNVQSQVINKTSESFDYIKKEVTWKIIINRNKMTLPNAHIIDVINENQEFVPSSVMVNGNYAKESNYDYNENTRTLTYNFPSEIEDQEVITFKTKIIDNSIFNSNGEKTINNKVKLVTDILPSGVESTGTATIKSTLVDKKASYTVGNSYIDWNVNINSNKILIKDAILTDILQDGLELDTTSVKLYKAILSSNGTLSKGEELVLGIDNVKYNATTRQFDFKLPSLTNESYILTFRTNVVDKRKSPFINSISFKGTGITEKSDSNKVDVIFQDAAGGGVGETGSIKVIKVNKDDENIKLQGAVFELLDRYKNVIKTSGETGGNGEAIFNRLRFDTDYYVREKTSPKGYILSNEVYKFQLANSGDDKNIVYNYKDEKITGEIQFFKIGDNDIPLQGAEFTLYKLSDTTYENPIATAKSDIIGEVKFKNVDYGEYTIKETKAPEGYSVSNTVLKASITENGKVVKANPYSISNEKIIGNIQFIKEGEDKRPLEGAEFKLYKEWDKDFQDPIAMAISDKNGHVQFNNIEYGKYNIRETRAPEGYNLSSEILKANVSENGKIIKADPYILFDTKIKGYIKIKKLDQDKKPLNGASFTLYNQDGNPVRTVASKKDGIALFENVEYGEYIIKETVVPEGYLPSENTIKVKVDKDGQLYTYEVINNRIRRTVTVTKVNSQGRRLEGAEFTLFSSDGKEITTVISNKNGIAVFKDLGYGNYIIRETKAPKGYILRKKQLLVNVNSTETQNFIIENEAYTPIVKKGHIPPNQVKKPTKAISVLPKTGSFLDFKVMIGIGSIAILTGIVLMLKTKK
ncbi:SpaA isopeptide-forming pilin-related protein [Clostridium sp. Marseille-Q2269]|uniref:SpaA isopeptide-forming pilin-related protein n=1 Tax=Clostridium sp. Marseille-Q2269 TaxID=2942205 RepID=UPI002072F877|nr:SpaA isopeptide-forming pilin-related protein [Clostridium sp. Marseille-Q2269]